MQFNLKRHTLLGEQGIEEVDVKLLHHLHGDSYYKDSTRSTSGVEYNICTVHSNT